MKNPIPIIWKAALLAAPLRLWAMIASGPVMLAFAAWLIDIISDPSWPLNLRDKQLDYLGWSLLLFVLINAVIIVTLAAVRLKGSGPGGVGFEIDADDKTE